MSSCLDAKTKDKCQSETGSTKRRKFILCKLKSPDQLGRSQSDDTEKKCKTKKSSGFEHNFREMDLAFWSCIAFLEAGSRYNKTYCTQRSLPLPYPFPSQTETFSFKKVCHCSAHRFLSTSSMQTKKNREAYDGSLVLHKPQGTVQIGTSTNSTRICWTSPHDDDLTIPDSNKGSLR